jgi:Tfp pilus assembly protein PilO
METKNREKLLLIATGACAVLYLLNLLVISPLIGAWNRRSDEITQLRKEIADGTRLEQRGSWIQSRWDSMRTNALESNPTTAERQMFTAFDRWVSASGVTENSFRPQLQESDTNYSTIDCRADVSGSYENIVGFLKAMDKDPLGVKVSSFELTKRDDNARQLTLGLTLSGLVLNESTP